MLIGAVLGIYLFAYIKKIAFNKRIEWKGFIINKKLIDWLIFLNDSLNQLKFEIVPSIVRFYYLLTKWLRFVSLFKQINQT